MGSFSDRWGPGIQLFKPHFWPQNSYFGRNLRILFSLPRRVRDEDLDLRSKENGQNCYATHTRIRARVCAFNVTLRRSREEAEG